MRDGPTGGEAALDRERDELLEQWEDCAEIPMLLLGVVWLGLLILELTGGLSPLLERLGTVIWGVFVVDFVLRFTLAPRKLPYLRRNWLTAAALLLPALRVFRAARVLRVLRLGRTARGLRLFRLLTSTNRGMRALRSTLKRRGFGYALILTLIVTLAGAAGMYAFEREAPAGGFRHYGDALWWTAMLMTTVGSEYFPLTAEGRILCFLLALYAFAVFGYLTATLATFFIGRDADAASPERQLSLSIDDLRTEVAQLRAELLSRSADRRPTA